MPIASDDPMRVAQNIRKAMDVDKLMLEIDGQLLMVPLGNVKYVQVSPSPASLPDGVLRHATFAD